MFSNGNWSRKSLFSGNNEQVILAQIYKLKLEVIQVKVMKRPKAEYFLNDSPHICKDYLRKIVSIVRGNVYHASCISMDISLLSVEGCDPINFNL